MNWDAIDAVGEILGAIAVLVTLIYVAVQVRQGRIAQKIEAIRNNRTERRDFFIAMRDAPYVPAIIANLNDGGEISDEEAQKITTVGEAVDYLSANTA